jgi:hypothetical protein
MAKRAPRMAVKTTMTTNADKAGEIADSNEKFSVSLTLSGINCVHYDGDRGYIYIQFPDSDTMLYQKWFYFTA